MDDILSFQRGFMINASILLAQDYKLGCSKLKLKYPILGFLIYVTRFQLLRMCSVQ
jgi:hypothetical protein